MCRSCGRPLYPAVQRSGQLMRQFLKTRAQSESVAAQSSLAEQALATAGMPTSAADIVKGFAMQPQFAAFGAKNGHVAPAVYTGQIFVSGWHPRVACDRRRRFGWSCDDLRYFVGKELLIAYRLVKSAFGTSEYVKTLVEAFRERIVVSNGHSQFSLQRDRLLRVTAFVDVPILGSCRVGRPPVPSCYSDH